MHDFVDMLSYIIVALMDCFRQEQNTTYGYLVTVAIGDWGMKVLWLP